MKKIMKISSILTVLVFTFFSCQKNDAVKPQEDKMYAIGTEVMSLTTGELEPGIIIGTMKQFEDFFNSGEERVGVQQVSTVNNIFTLHPVDSPYAVDCEDQYRRQFNEHYAEWLEEANEHCTRVVKILTCSIPDLDVAKVSVTISPNAPKCKEIKAWATSLAAFDFAPGDYDGGAVTAYIHNLKY